MDEGTITLLGGTPHTLSTPSRALGLSGSAVGSETPWPLRYEVMSPPMPPVLRTT